MLYRRRPEKIFYYGKPVDFRKQTMGLAAIVDAELPGEMQHGHWFVFVSSDKKKAKILYWRGTGVALPSVSFRVRQFELVKLGYI